MSIKQMLKMGKSERKAQIFELWNQLSKRPNIISEKSGIKMEEVVDILESLQSEEYISGFEKIVRTKGPKISKKVLLFEELIDPKILGDLKVTQLAKGGKQIGQYLFKEKEVDELYDAHFFEVRVDKIFYQETTILIPLNVEHKGKEYEVILIYTPDEEVYYGSRTGKGDLEKLRSALGEHMNVFDAITGKILDDHIPVDFWEIRSSLN